MMQDPENYEQAVELLHSQSDFIDELLMTNQQLRGEVKKLQAQAEFMQKQLAQIYRSMNSNKA